jgi:hypothetical protein
MTVQILIVSRHKKVFVVNLTARSVEKVIVHYYNLRFKRCFLFISLNAQRNEPKKGHFL